MKSLFLILVFVCLAWCERTEDGIDGTCGEDEDCSIEGVPVCICPESKGCSEKLGRCVRLCGDNEDCNEEGCVCPESKEECRMEKRITSLLNTENEQFSRCGPKTVDRRKLTTPKK
ncbi:uncharacterized protein LOC117110754 [Anneissia japonica]|uniref:uncharacterized protein LOC117110754 n=1 Tax=Anneissia japonica TaxID=1529436 RepID=UPI001425B090|nr:uncharacterized protein LOC117110754 [Anneissia japonica]